MRRRFFAFSLLVLLSCSYLEDLGTSVEKSSSALTGVVLDSLSGLPLSGVALSCAGRNAITGADGRFRLQPLFTGDKELALSLADYRPLTRAVRVTEAPCEDLEFRLLRVNRPPALTALFPDRRKGRHPLALRFKVLVSDPDRLLPRSSETLRYALSLDTSRTPGLVARGTVPVAPAATASFQAVLPDTLLRPLVAGATYHWRLAVYDLLGDSAILSDTFRTRIAYAPCPSGMALVENDSLRSGICMDSFEVNSRDYDSLMGVSPASTSRQPKVNIRPDSANSYCTRAGKQFCHKLALQAAISQYDGREYPYGPDYRPDTCNTSFPNAFTGGPETGGTRAGCVNDYGIYDLSGNVAEWVVGTNEDWLIIPSDIRGRQFAYYMGGFWAGGENSGWNTIDTTYNLIQPFIGFRCCTNPR